MIGETTPLSNFYI